MNVPGPLRRAFDWLRRVWPFRHLPTEPAPWGVAFVEGDILPTVIAERCVTVVRDGGDLWSAGMVCPCGCGETIELALFPEADQSWTFRIEEDGSPSIRPSIWRKTGCRSHFWLTRGRLRWCSDDD